MTRVLEPGMVVTIEPGLYFIDMLLDEVKKNGHAASVDWARVDAFRPYGGIRIEDEVMCTDGDAVNLTRPAFAAAPEPALTRKNPVRVQPQPAAQPDRGAGVRIVAGHRNRLGGQRSHEPLNGHELCDARQLLRSRTKLRCSPLL